jgi:hypothetical protein
MIWHKARKGSNQVVWHNIKSYTFSAVECFFFLFKKETTDIKDKVGYVVVVLQLFPLMSFYFVIVPFDGFQLSEFSIFRFRQGTSPLVSSL